MSVSLNVGETGFCIKAPNKSAALAALKAARTRADIGTATTLEEALKFLSWEADNQDSPGDIDWLAFDGDRYGDEDAMFHALAPFVESGSTIEAEAEGEPFRWRFEDGKLFIDQGHVLYAESEEEYAPAARGVISGLPIEGCNPATAITDLIGDNKNDLEADLREAWQAEGYGSRITFYRWVCDVADDERATRRDAARRLLAEHNLT